MSLSFGHTYTVHHHMGNKFRICITQVRLSRCLGSLLQLATMWVPSACGCGTKFLLNMLWALSCPKSGFPFIWHNEIRDLTANLLSKVCNDVCILNRAELQPINGEVFTTCWIGHEWRLHGQREVVLEQLLLDYPALLSSWWLYLAHERWQAH